MFRCLKNIFVKKRKAIRCELCENYYYKFEYTNIKGLSPEFICLGCRISKVKLYETNTLHLQANYGGS